MPLALLSFLPPILRKIHADETFLTLQGRPLEGMNALFEHSIWQMRRQGATYGQEAKQAQLERDEEDARYVAIEQLEGI